jgi:hypothetical protein
MYNGRDPETKKRKYLNQTVHSGPRDAQCHLNKMLGERDRGRNLDSSKQTLNQYLDRRLWPSIAAISCMPGRQKTWTPHSARFRIVPAYVGLGLFGEGPNVGANGYGSGRERHEYCIVIGTSIRGNKRREHVDTSSGRCQIGSQAV